MSLPNRIEIAELLPEMITDQGNNLSSLCANGQPVLLVFLRHFGCTFCREAMSDISRERAHLESQGVRIVLVHMSDHETALKYFKRYELETIEHIGDPDCRFYKGFGLLKGNFHQLFGLQSWIRGFDAGVLEGHGVGYQQIGDGFQMPGAFVLRDDEIIESYIHKLASDRPDYHKLISCCMRPLKTR